jgi:hypothetical protein
VHSTQRGACLGDENVAQLALAAQRARHVARVDLGGRGPAGRARLRQLLFGACDLLRRAPWVHL